ncbi:MAG: VOC family protein [Myxococcales bacterium]|nr:VOC family protein [Myxococcales bacterium]
MAHFILYVRDQARSREFYRTVLQRVPRLDVPGMTELELSRHAVLGLMPAHGIGRLLKIEPPANDARELRAELYLRVPDVKAWHDRALAAGARELSPPAKRDWGDEVSYVADPDDYVLAFARGAD